MTGQRFMDLGQMRDIPNFTEMLNTNEVCGAFFAAPRDKFSICDHVKICRYILNRGFEFQYIDTIYVLDNSKSARKTI